MAGPASWKPVLTSSGRRACLWKDLIRAVGGRPRMFERYTERARRVIFFARYEASRYGSTTIETEHLLLGLIREDIDLFRRASASDIRRHIEERLTIREKVSTSIDLPLSPECKRVLAYAAEEAERLKHGSIETGYLLLGMLREEKSVAAEFLHAHGFRLDAMREEMARAPIPLDPASARA